jgi:hypothetical protein
MFSRSFVKSPEQNAQDIARRANPTRERVRRSAICSGEHNYSYPLCPPNSFRVFQDQDGSNSYAENLIRDYREVFEKGNTTLPYHAALTALHHNAATKSAANFLAQLRVIHQLVAMHNSPTPAPAPAPAIAPAPAPAPAPEPTCFAKARRQLAKMKFDLPSPHPKRLVVYRSPKGYDLNYINPNFDPESFASSERNTFVKTCCRRYCRVQACCCFKRKSRTSVNYVNQKGEAIHVYYLERKTDYQNLTRSYPQYYHPDEAIPCSPRGDVSESDMFPWDKDYDFEEERSNALQAEREGFTHVWTSKTAERRHKRRIARQQQLASGELPEFGLIIVTFDIDEVSRVNNATHAQLRQEHKQEYEDLQQHVRFYESWEEEHHSCSLSRQSAPSPPLFFHPLSQVPTVPTVPAPAPRFDATGLCPFQIRRLVQHEKKDNSIVAIQRPISDTSLTIAHAVTRAQVTEISALKTYQHTRLAGRGALTAILAIRFGAAPGISSMVAATLHHDVIQRILRRATGSEATANQIAAPYIKSFTKPSKSALANRCTELREAMRTRFDRGIPKIAPPSAGPRLATFPASDYGPIEFKQAKYYAAKCLELMGNPNDSDSASPSAAKWAHLRTQVQRVRRGEIEASDVYTSPEYNNWVYAIYYTYVTGARLFLAACLFAPPQPLIPSPPSSIKCRRHRRPKYWFDCKEIRVDAPRYVQTTLMVREMYRFIVKAHHIFTPEFMSVFGMDSKYVNSIINRTKHLACHDGDEASALMFGFMMPALMTPEIHLDIFVEGRVFQHPDLYVKMSDPVFGPIKKQLKDMIPSRHTGVIDRATLMDEQKIIWRA